MLDSILGSRWNCMESIWPSFQMGYSFYLSILKDFSGGSWYLSSPSMAFYPQIDGQEVRIIQTLGTYWERVSSISGVMGWLFRLLHSSIFRLWKYCQELMVIAWNRQKNTPSRSPMVLIKPFVEPLLEVVQSWTPIWSAIGNGKLAVLTVEPTWLAPTNCLVVSSSKLYLTLLNGQVYILVPPADVDACKLSAGS